MEKYTFEFLIHDQMLNPEYEAQKKLAIQTNIEKYLEDIQEYDRFENHSRDYGTCRYYNHNEYLQRSHKGT